MVVAALVMVSVAGFPAQTPGGGSGFPPETILTEWETFRCSAIECAEAPRAGLEVYWAPPTLVIIPPGPVDRRDRPGHRGRTPPTARRGPQCLTPASSPATRATLPSSPAWSPGIGA